MSRHSVFAHSNGVYKGISLSPMIKNHVTNIEERMVYGEIVEECENGTNVLAFVDLEFESYEVQHQYCENLEEYIKPIIE